MNHEILKILGDTDIFFDSIFKLLDAHGIDVSDYELDHICYRVESIERYNELKNIFLEYGILLGEHQINGREISTFKFTHPFTYKNRNIYVLELPQPKAGSPYNEGFEHVEFVIDESFDSFMKKYPDISFNTKALGKEINPDVAIKNEKIGIKFHRQSLEYVVLYLE